MNIGADSPLARHLHHPCKEDIHDTFSEWIEDGVSKFAASLAFYTLFSFGPILIILLAIGGAL